MFGPPPSLSRALEIAQEPPFFVRREGGLVLVGYRGDSLDDREKPWTWERRELRGIVYQEEGGTPVSRPFHRFFNLGDPRSGIHPDRPLGPGDLIAPKADGRLLQAFVLEGKPRLATRGSLVLGQVRASLAKAWTPDHETLVLRAHAQLGRVTLLFELLDPERPVMERPERASALLLAIRRVETGDYLFPKASPEVAEILRGLEVPYVPWEPAGAGRVGELYRNIQDLQGQEGFVLWLAEGDFLKLKTAWALGFTRLRWERGRLLASFLEALLEDRLDDLMAALSGEPGLRGEVLQWEQRLLGLLDQAVALAGEVGAWPRKEAYAHLENTLANHPHKGFLLRMAMAAYEGGRERAWRALKGWLRQGGQRALQELLEA